MKLILCNQCDCGCFTEEQARRHEQETGHTMDRGREVTPLSLDEADAFLRERLTPDAVDAILQESDNE